MDKYIYMGWHLPQLLSQHLLDLTTAAIPGIHSREFSDQFKLYMGENNSMKQIQKFKSSCKTFSGVYIKDKEKLAPANLVISFLRHISKKNSENRN